MFQLPMECRYLMADEKVLPRATFWLLVACMVCAADERSSIGREVSIPNHLNDGQEFFVPLEKLLAHGKLLFNANWTDQEGGGRPLTKGTGRPLSDPGQPLSGNRRFNRISGPDANSCAGCHN